jgi:hypothetical protein
LLSVTPAEVAPLTSCGQYLTGMEPLTPHFRRCGLLHVDHAGDGSGAAQFPEDVINIVHVDTYNTIRVSVST